MKKMTYVLLAFLLNGQVYAATCRKLVDCVNKVAALTGKKYFFDKDLKGIINVSPNFKLDKKNADDFISMVLNSKEMTRVPLKQKNSYRIVHARDIRYTPTNIYAENSMLIPDNDDYIMVIFDLKNVNSRELTRSLRPFISRYGRIMNIASKNRIIIQDTGKNILRVRKLIKAIDTPLTSEEKERYEEKKEHNRKLELLKAKHCKK